MTCLGNNGEFSHCSTEGTRLTKSDRWQVKPIVKVVSTIFPLGLGITYLSELCTPRLNGGRSLLSSDTNIENPTRAMLKAPFESSW